MKRLLLLPIFFLAFTLAQAQTNEGNNWYFGQNCGLTWNTYQSNGNPMYLMDAMVNTNEGVATISDDMGNLLFYTDGSVVYNANHQMMTNSSSSSPGGELLGDWSASQSAVVVPKPLDANTFYIFTVDAQLGSGGLAYSRVDMTANGGLGDIDLAEKNIMLFNPTTEKITAVQHANGLDVWVISHQWNNNQFNVYLVNSSGVQNLTPVISMIGEVHSGTSTSTIGYLKASPGGTMLALANSGPDYWEIFEFNNATGVISNNLLLNDPSFNDCYGVEFSPDQHYLYGSQCGGGNIHQWDVTTFTLPALNASHQIVATYGCPYGGAIQLAPDQKIYCSRYQTKYVARINEPNQPGISCDYEDLAVLLGPTEPQAKTAMIGLPTFITSFFNNAEFTFETSCLDTITTFTIPNTNGLDYAYWNFNYPSTDPQWLLTDTTFIVDFVYNAGGVFQVQLITERDNVFDTLVQSVVVSYLPVLDLGPDTVLCTNEAIQMDLSHYANYSLAGFASYYWEADIGPNTYYDSSANYLIDKPGLYHLSIYTDSICGSTTDEFEVFYNNVEADLGIDITSGLCVGDVETLDATYSNPVFGNTTYMWSTNQNTSTINVTTSGTYTVTVSLDECEDIDEIEVWFDQALQPPLADSEYLCIGSSILLDALNPGANYIWSTGGFAQEEEILTAGIYTLTISNACGAITDEIELLELGDPAIDLGADITICEGTVEHLDADNGMSDQTFSWSTGEQTPQIAVASQGIYSVTVSNQCGSSMDMIYVASEAAITNIFNTDTAVCAGFVLDSEIADATYSWSTGEQTQSIVISATGDYELEITNACGTVSDIIHVEIIDLVGQLPSDTSLCPGVTLLLDAGNTGALYHWSDGSNNQVAEINTAGIYTLEMINECGSTFDTIVVSSFNVNLDLGEDTAICAGDIYILDATQQDASYQWSTGEITPSIEVLTSGQYAVTVSHHCGDIDDDVSIEVLESPEISFGVDSLISQTDSVLLSPNLLNVSSCVWSTGETSEAIVVTQPGWYTIEVVSDAGCFSTAAVYVDFYWGIEEFGANSNSITVYPNPANKFVTINYATFPVDLVQVFNSLGQLVIQKNETGKGLLRIETTGLQNGLYFIKLHTEEGHIFVEQFTVSR